MSQRQREAPHPVQLVRPAIPPEDLPPAPAHLSDAMRSWWQRVMLDFELDQHHLLLLQAACEAFDRAAQARQVLDKEGLTITVGRGRRKHPAADIERDSKTLFARLVRELDLDADPPKETPGWRPPPLRSNRRR